MTPFREYQDLEEVTESSTPSLTVKKTQMICEIVTFI